MTDAVVYVHSQHDLPRCFWSSLKKTRELWDGDIYLVAPRREISYGELKEYGVKFVSEDWHCDNACDGIMGEEAETLVRRYENATFFRERYPLWNNFWDNACKRFVYLYAVQSKYKIDRIIHLETDVVPYLGLKQMFDSLGRVYKNKIVFSPHVHEQLSCCFIYCDAVDIMKMFCDSIIEYFGRGVGYFEHRYPAQPILNETNFAYTFYLEHEELVGLFPTMPGEEHHSELGFLIDSTSWGMWVNGLHRNKTENGRYAAPTHHIGKKLLDGTYGVLFEIENERIVLPWVHNKKTNMTWPLATLHFNSKRPERWI